MEDYMQYHLEWLEGMSRDMEQAFEAADEVWLSDEQYRLHEGVGGSERRQIWVTPDGKRWRYEFGSGNHWLMRRVGFFARLRDPVWIHYSYLKRLES